MVENIEQSSIRDCRFAITANKRLNGLLKRFLYKVSKLLIYIKQNNEIFTK